MNAHINIDGWDPYVIEDDEASVSIETAWGAPEAECPDCGWQGDADDVPATDFGERVCPECGYTEVAVRHECFNGAGVNVLDDGARVRVWVSVADPRGSFVMEVSRAEDGSLRLSVPTPEDGLLHAPLTPLGSPGFYRIGL